MIGKVSVNGLGAIVDESFSKGSAWPDILTVHFSGVMTVPATQWFIFFAKLLVKFRKSLFFFVLLALPKNSRWEVHGAKKFWTMIC